VSICSESVTAFNLLPAPRATRHLFHRDAKLFGEQQQLYVEYPGREMLTGEYLLGSLSGEKFETALGVSDVANDAQGVHEEVAEEGMPCPCEHFDRSKKRQTDLYDGLGFEGVGTAPSRDRRLLLVLLVQRGSEHLKVFEPTGPVGVCHQESFTPSVQHSAPYGSTVARVLP
jgi:hypothetical protein